MQLPDGLRLNGGRLVFPESVCVLHTNDMGQIALVRQKRTTHGHDTLELPGGKVNEGETLAQAALRELLEESGHAGQDAEELITLDMDFSVSVHRTHLLRVRKLVPTDRTPEFDLTWLSVEEAVQRIHTGEITHAPTVTGVLLLAQEERAR
jgi:ADP-ribose pyrophosphatase